MKCIELLIKIKILYQYIILYNLINCKLSFMECVLNKNLVNQLYIKNKKNI